jgi:ubiquitin C-terminal hydrolase
MSRGLVNKGNSCWFNSAVQALFYVPALNRRLCDEGYDGTCSVTRLLAAVFLELRRTDTRAAVDPGELLDAFKARFQAFRNRRQHDAAEALLLLVGVFEDSLGKAYVESLFAGASEQTVTFLKFSTTELCSESKTVTTLWSVNIEVPEPLLSVDELLKRAEHPQTLENYVDGAGEVHPLAIVTIKITKVPQTAILVFDSQGENSTVRIPKTWRGRQLCAVVLHRGRCGFGHYVCVGRAAGSWWLKDDEAVESIQEESGDFLDAPAYSALYSTL